MQDSSNYSPLQSCCAGCGRPGVVPTTSTPPELALGIEFVNGVPRFWCKACRAARAQQRRLERRARP